MGARTMSAKSDRVKAAILKSLQDVQGASGATRIVERLSAMGIALQPRSVRVYLQQMDRDGLTRFVSRRRGREITERGREELAHTHIAQNVGFISAKMDSLGYQMTYDRDSNRGAIIANLALIDRRAAGIALREIAQVFEKRCAMGARMIVAEAGEQVGKHTVPEGMIGVGTVCSVTINGILLHEGIPVVSRFGGLVEMRDGRPLRFVELIQYEGTTLDPLEAFIKAGMTRVRECVRTGSGIIGASFREIPSAAVDAVGRIQKSLEARGLGGVLALGRPSRPLLDVPVSEGRAGMVIIGGLNPVAAVHEAGVRLTMMSLSGLVEYESFVSFKEGCRRYA